MASTLYPKITNNLIDIRYNLLSNGLIEASEVTEEGDTVTYTPDSLPIVGTVKLHGTHADILITSTNEIGFQSRNRLQLTVENDNYDFAATMSQQYPAILRLRARYLERFLAINPDARIEEDRPLILAGEWIGEKIQKKVAICALKPRFVIVSCSINGKWQNDEDYKDLFDEEAGIYHIGRGDFYHSTVNFNDLDHSLADLQKYTTEVEQQCPFAATFGLTGLGEGIVWKFFSHPNWPDTWFKVKGDAFLATQRAPKDLAARDPARGLEKGAAGELAERAVTEVRLEQGWDYLREMGEKREKKNISKFVNWIWNDIMVEEKTEIRERGIVGAKLKDYVMYTAKPWFVKRIEQIEQERQTTKATRDIATAITD